MVILSIFFFINHVSSDWLLSTIVTLIAIIILLLSVKLRGYAVYLQDRIIRNEENFRYYRLTGELLDSRLTLKQVIALRFADDEEYLGLVERALSENLSPDGIKKSVNNWKSDYHRV
ncbi:hypothetical protein SAMN05216565_108157 [Litchfieldia salsa]|uniref:Uncharacterized protein n=1 Tax=Litchfieldia salsa TaxID=930152 RepID=A0A1H0W0J1_9BACI|nr:hypothetical protein SAMN05216565_108157 [Litchfieldia salsa]